MYGRVMLVFVCKKRWKRKLNLVNIKEKHQASYTDPYHCIEFNHPCPKLNLETIHLIDIGYLRPISKSVYLLLIGPNCSLQPGHHHHQNHLLQLDLV